MQAPFLQFVVQAALRLLIVVAESTEWGIKTQLEAWALWGRGGELWVSPRTHGSWFLQKWEGWWVPSAALGVARGVPWRNLSESTFKTIKN